MARRKIARPPLRDLDNVCGYCLFFQAQTMDGNVSCSGNCAYHKEWIENAYRTTCSDMSEYPLKEKGIYHLVSKNGSGWQYVRRTEKLRTRLFAVK
jgi:hypothetical protein